MLKVLHLNLVFDNCTAFLKQRKEIVDTLKNYNISGYDEIVTNLLELVVAGKVQDFKDESKRITTKIFAECNTLLQEMKAAKKNFKK